MYYCVILLFKSSQTFSFSQPNACLCVAEAYLRVHSENTWSLPGYSNHLEGEFMVKTAPISTSDV